jgi:ribonuclease HI
MNILQYDEQQHEIKLLQNNTVVFSGVFPYIAEALVGGFTAALKAGIQEVKLRGFPMKANNKVQCIYGESFKHKFKYASHKPSKFIAIMLEESEKQTDLGNKLVCLLSPFYRIEYETDLVINLGTTYNATQFVNDNAWSVKTENFNKPSVSFFTDAAVKEDSYMAGYGISDKDIVVSFRFKESCQDNNLAELKAIKQAIIIAKEMNLPSIEVFTDSCTSIDALNAFQVSKYTVHNKFKIIVDEIYEMLQNFESYKIAWISRKENKLADQMSKPNFAELVA